jgi:alkylation response protein AidB-like acyl-CoA dehydrogenase
MRFQYTEDQVALRASIDEIVAGCGGTAVLDDWSAGILDLGLAVWQEFARVGLVGLRVPREEGGMAAGPPAMVVAFEGLGYHALPGPYAASVALLPALVDAATRADLAAGAMGTIVIDGLVPYALDADVAAHPFVISDGSIARATAGDPRESMSPLRRLFTLTAGECAPVDPCRVARAVDESTLAHSAYMLGVAQRLLDESVHCEAGRDGSGRTLGESESVKHQLADVKIATAFAQPLVHHAALTVDGVDRARNVSAAKLAATTAAQLAARVALHVHGPAGVAAQSPVGHWVTLVPAMSSLWGGARYHRDRVGAAVLGG